MITKAALDFVSSMMLASSLGFGVLLSSLSVLVVQGGIALLAGLISPFMTTEGLPGVVKSLWIALGCRILFGVVAGILWKLMKKLLKQDYVCLPVTAAVATMVHTLLVMGSIYVLLASQYAQAKNVAVTAVFGLVMGTVTASGIPEAIVAAILVTVLGKTLLRLNARMQKMTGR